MRKEFLSSTALVSSVVMFSGVAGAAEPPEWKLSGRFDIQGYYADQDLNGTVTIGGVPGIAQDHGYYFGIDEAELRLDVKGSMDNGLKYSVKVEVNSNTDDDKAADELVAQFSGDWGILQIGDEDGAEDRMNYGGENVMGGPGGFNGDHGDWYVNVGEASASPKIKGDTSDATKVTYYTPRFSGVQLGASLTPTPNDGSNKPLDGAWEDHYGIGANYDKKFGDLRLRLSAVYSAATSNDPLEEDVSAYSVGSMANFGSFSIGVNYTDNGDSSVPLGSGDESSYWNVAGGFKTGPFYLSIGYMSSVYEFGAAGGGEDTYTQLAFTTDYTMSPNVKFYLDAATISSEDSVAPTAGTNDGTGAIIGTRITF